jgi:5'-nucleotidase
MKRILVSNDDGIYAPGLAALVAVLEPLAEVTVVAPLAEQSASSHALTLHHPLRIREMGPRRFAVEGTPTDCVLLASNILLDGEPDLVVSGINQGPNMGEDVIYSGTVAAAMEGSILGYPSLAMSLASYTFREFAGAASVTAALVERLLGASLPQRFLLNVNVPPVPREEIRGLRVTRLGTRVYKDIIVKNTDPRGRDYYWIGGGKPDWAHSPDSDYATVGEGYASLTPLLMDLTDGTRMDFLRDLDLRWAP